MMAAGRADRRHFSPAAQNSKDAKIFCLLHKMDLVQEAQRALVFAEREAELKRRALPLDITCFGTSIWDESLYKVPISLVGACLVVCPRAAHGPCTGLADSPRALALPFLA